MWGALKIFPSETVVETIKKTPNAMLLLGPVQGDIIVTYLAIQSYFQTQTCSLVSEGQTCTLSMP